MKRRRGAPGRIAAGVAVAAVAVTAQVVGAGTAHAEPRGCSATRVSDQAATRLTYTATCPEGDGRYRVLAYCRRPGSGSHPNPYVTVARGPIVYAGPGTSSTVTCSGERLWSQATTEIVP
ncbi:hypothetical protein [Actinomadura flavalba]|uniref:hypothetical protein n=1 Tax=Actinomadura flavalba TaxID=1120938 RepID=UPI000370EE2F|nr:hypothetical protein [Actinomadura flavalba]